MAVSEENHNFSVIAWIFYRETTQTENDQRTPSLEITTITNKSPLYNKYFDPAPPISKRDGARKKKCQTSKQAVDEKSYVIFINHNHLWASE